MLIELRTLKELTLYIQEVKRAGQSIGFVPTMGFLHKGHMSLVDLSKEKTDITISSIYVNPSQFNEPSDFDSYPRDEAKDITLLHQHGCNAVFIPTKEEMESIVPKSVDLEDLDTVMEGKFRPNHFEGVVEVVYRLFSVVTPDYAFFGEKDFQQIMVVQKMVSQLNLPVQIVKAPIIRESNGLAMSSRNSRLTISGRLKAGFLFDVLKRYGHEKREDLEQLLIDHGFELEYLEVHQFGGEKRVFIAGLYEGVRLIDNLAFN